MSHKQSLYLTILQQSCHIYAEAILRIAEYASCLGPPKHQGPPCSQRCLNFIVVLVLNLASAYENMNDKLL